MTVTGVDQLNKNLELLRSRYGKAVADALIVSGEMVKSTAVRSIQNKSNGQAVTRYRTGGGSYTHITSAPNSAPNTDTGRLVSSVAVEKHEGDVYVGSGLEYAPYLEFGTVNMTQRPWLNPALEQNRRRISTLISNAIKQTSDRGAK